MENRYDKYKDSGIAWIGEIPEHWEVIKTKNAFNIISGATPKTDNIAYWDGEITWITPADYKTEDIIIKSGKRNITTEGLNSCGTSIVPQGSVIFSKRAPIGLVAINAVPLCTNQGCISCIPKPYVNTKYFYYLMSVLTEWFELFGSGTTFKELSTNNFANFSLSQPSFTEQQSIATYLDQKCGEIDELITLQEEMITKLQSYKQSVITETVTKGLDKNVPLKDSGIEWIGEIPEHWEIRKLKNIFLLSTGTTPKDFDKISEEDNLINWYTPSDILDSCNDLFSSQRKLSEKVIYENKISLFPIGTLLYVGIGASAGKVGYANENGYSNQQITGLIPLECYSRFYFYYLSALKDKIRDNAFFTTLPIINNAYLGQELIPYPPIHEQQSIANYLVQKCSEIDELISIKQQKIEKMKDYKKSLIFECVTGKRKVS